jgi:hypothetical protein
MVELILLAANCFFAVWPKRAGLNSMQKHNALNLKQFMGYTLLVCECIIHGVMMLSQN